MDSIAISVVVFSCVFGGALFGMWLRKALPQPHLSEDSKTAVKLGSGLVATLCALLLGLLIASAKSSYDAQNTELMEMSAKVVMLDRVLAHYGPETNQCRVTLRGYVERALSRIWAKDQTYQAPSGSAEAILDQLEDLTPKDAKQTSLKELALGLALSLGQTRWLQFEQKTSSVSMPLVVMLVFWLCTIFISFGLFAPTNGTVIIGLLVSAFSVSCAILLILELYTPYTGLIAVSNAPLKAALAQLGL
jgi:hypothetical protein